MKIIINRKDVERIVAHSRDLKRHPEEACGLLAGIDRPAGIREIRKLYILTNVDHSREHFTIDPKEHLAAVKDMRALGLRPLGNWHSHPESPSRPSEEDKRLANDSTASYLILSLEDADHPVLNAFHIEGPEEDRTVRMEELIIG